MTIFAIGDIRPQKLLASVMHKWPLSELICIEPPKFESIIYKSKFKLSVHQKKPFKAPQSPKIKSFYIFYKKFTQHKTYNFNLKSLKVILKNLL